MRFTEYGIYLCTGKIGTDKLFNKIAPKRYEIRGNKTGVLVSS